MNIEKRYGWYIFAISVTCVSVLLGNSYSSPKELLALALVSVIGFVGVSEYYAQNFSYPLFFARERPTIWGGLFGGYTAMISAYVGFRVGFFFDITLVDIFLAVLCFLYLFSISIILYTGSVMKDMNS